MDEEGKKKPVIEVVRDNDNWLDAIPKLSVTEEADKTPTIFGKSSFNLMSVAVQDIKVTEGMRKLPLGEFEYNYSNRINGEGNISGFDENMRPRGDTIGFFGGKRHSKIGFEITCEPYEPTEEERKENIAEKGIDTSEHDYIILNGFDEEFYLSVHLRDKTRFDELVRRISIKEITSLSITISELGKVPGLYRPEYLYYPEVDYRSGQDFYLLRDEDTISNLTKEELDTIPNKLHFDSYYWQLTSRYSIVDFTIVFNPSWVTSELFDEEDEEEFDGIEEEIEEEYEDSFFPKPPTSDEHIAEQTVVLNRIHKSLIVIAILLLILIFTN
tara:strand:- start:255 stop:1238 length:984 start_codon:yes stop_codon:yes gene_type:complete